VKYSPGGGDEIVEKGVDLFKDILDEKEFVGGISDQIVSLINQSRFLVAPSPAHDHLVRIQFRITSSVK